ncbi:trypsin-like peptidase domain-containing protein [Candidatus Uhrbacteria bacterium]|nr:trypsin-like peptidase domain-containing protein [Candidatus Uhrbacteria bacterium]
MVSFQGFIGAIAVGELTANGGKPFFNVRHVLGSGFIVDPVRGVGVTNHHVLPEAFWPSQVAFYTLGPDGSWRAHILHPEGYARMPAHDVVRFRVITPSSGTPLRTYPFHTGELKLSVPVSALGLPRDLMADPSGPISVTIRAQTGHVVSGYHDDIEVDVPFIQGMSGSPVVAGDRIVGIAYRNRQYALEQRILESEEVSEGDGVTRREVHRYEEVLRFGVFYKAKIIKDWLQLP